MREQRWRGQNIVYMLSQWNVVSGYGDQGGKSEIVGVIPNYCGTC